MALHIKRPQVLWAVLALTMVITLLLVACGSGAAGAATRQSASAQVVRVSIVENNGRYAFAPAAITIPKGSQVVWVNGSDASHTVTSSGGFASSGLIGQRQSFSATFSNAGTFAYHCTVHPYMMGTVIVK
ncbi:MAG TPA: plastocyanin/azurin family copper-binding protein [Ktedonobacteraceae bacterium]|nr:plastocyanin/azurin family copper-binding protein [Ktedonobacteraceae bacterium]